MLKRKEGFKFSGRNHSVKGMISFLIGLFVLFAFLVLVILSSVSGGNGGMLLGILGILFAFFNIGGFVIGIKSLKEKEIYYVAPVGGIILNGILIVVFFMLYLLGFFL